VQELEIVDIKKSFSLGKVMFVTKHTKKEEAPMSHITKNLPTIKELEQWLFRKLKEEFARAMALIPETRSAYYGAAGSRTLLGQRRTRSECRYGVWNSAIHAVSLFRPEYRQTRLFAERLLAFEGRCKFSPRLEETAVGVRSKAGDDIRVEGNKKELT